jgi:HlyD family secretion protein
MRIRRKYLIWAGIAIGAGGLVWLGMRESPIDVDTALVRRATLMVTVDAEGKTRVRDRYTLTAPIAGRLHRIDLPEGTHVRAQDIVARISPMPLDVQSLRQAEARVAAATALAHEADTHVRQARASLEQEQRSAVRAVRLAEAGALAERQREEALLSVRLRDDELTGAVSRARAAAADVQQARAALIAVGGGSPAVTVPIRAPADGCVLRVHERSERVVAPGSPIAEIGDPAALELVVDILSSDAARVRPGTRVLLDTWGEGESLSGRVRRVEPAAFTRVSSLGVEEQRVNVVIDVANPPAELGDGYRVEARIVVWEQPGTVVVPVSALFRQGDAWAVFVVKEDRATIVPVRVGERAGIDAQVLSGLAVGDTVIVFPSDQIKAGRRVAPAR